MPATETPRRRPFRLGRWTSRVRQHPEALGELPVAALAEEILTPGDGRIRALITIAGNPARSTPDSEAARRRALESLDLMVSIDPYRNETTRHADVILPPPSHLERSHYDLAFWQLSVRNVANYSPATLPITDGRPDEWEILLRLTAIAAGLGADADLAMLDEIGMAGQVGRDVADPRLTDFGEGSRRDHGGAVVRAAARSASSTTCSAPVRMATPLGPGRGSPWRRWRPIRTGSTSVPSNPDSPTCSPPRTG